MSSKLKEKSVDFIENHGNLPIDSIELNEESSNDELFGQVRLLISLINNIHKGYERPFYSKKGSVRNHLRIFLKLIEQPYRIFASLNLIIPTDLVSEATSLNLTLFDFFRNIKIQISNDVRIKIIQLVEQIKQLILTAVQNVFDEHYQLAYQELVAPAVLVL